MIGADEAPDTFLIYKPEPVGQGIFRGTKVPVRIQDVIAASGERVPGVREAQKEFTLGMYLLYEGNRAPDAEKARMAEGIERALIGYFGAATGGRMRVVAAEARPRLGTGARK